MPPGYPPAPPPAPAGYPPPPAAPGYPPATPPAATGGGVDWTNAAQTSPEENKRRLADEEARARAPHDPALDPAARPPLAATGGIPPGVQDVMARIAAVRQKADGR